MIHNKKARKKRTKMKPLLPSLRERKRYVVYEIISKEPVSSARNVSKAIIKSSLGFLGELGCSKAGIMILEDKYDQKKQRGLIKVNYKYVDKLKASLALVSDIENSRVVITTLGTSGTMKKAEGKYIAS